MSTRRILRNIVVIIGLLFFFNACMKETSYPVEPQITFESFGVIKSTGEFPYDSIGVLLFSFVDGDGDVGKLNDDDSTLNVIVNTFQLENNQFVHKENVKFSSRLPDLPRSENQDYLKGTIQNNLSFHTLFSAVLDTIKFEVYIIDQAGNESNTIEVPTFILTQRPKPE